MGEREAERLRAQAKEATRRALLEAGLTELLERGGLETPSIETICTRAGYTRGAFYVHFEGREEFVTEVLDWVLTDVVATLFDGPTEDATGLGDVLTRFTDALANRRLPDVEGRVRAAYLGVMRAVGPGGPVRERHAGYMEEVIERLAGAIQSTQARGELSPGPDPQALATIVVLMSVGMIMWDDIGIPLDAPALGRAFLDILEVPDLEITTPSEPHGSSDTSSDASATPDE